MKERRKKGKMLKKRVGIDEEGNEGQEGRGLASS